LVLGLLGELKAGNQAHFGFCLEVLSWSSHARVEQLILAQIENLQKVKTRQS
jgi:hypothetical protein